MTASDVLRVAAAVSLVPAALWHGGVGFAVVFLVVGGCMVPRALGTPGWLDALFCSTAIFAAWAALLDWYVAVDWLDLAVHAVATGLIGALAWQAVDKAGLLVSCEQTGRARAAAVLVVVCTATTLATLWEIGEWLGHTYLDPSIQIGQTDTMTDLAAGIGGAFLAGLLVARHWVTAPDVPTASVEPPNVRQRTLRRLGDSA